MSATRHTLALSPLEEEVLTPLEPFIMLSGLPGAETRLMRALLDDHPQVRCGESLGVIHNMVRLWRTFTAPAERQRLQLAGISQMVVMEAAQLFLLDVLANNGPSASRLCTRDVLALTGGVFLKTLFPNVKFIFLVRDTRAAATHLVHRQVPVMGRRLRSVEEGLRMLEDLLMLLRRECRMLGPHHCLPVHYEALVLNPRKTLERVLEFLEVEWDEAVLHHHLHTGVFVSSKRQLYLDSLTAWVVHFPDYLKLCPRCYYHQAKFLGYDSFSFPPDYSRLASYDWSSPMPWRPGRGVQEFLTLVGKLAAKGAGQPVHNNSHVDLYMRAFLYV